MDDRPRHGDRADNRQRRAESGLDVQPQDQIQKGDEKKTAAQPEKTGGEADHQARKDKERPLRDAGGPRRRLLADDKTPTKRKNDDCRNQQYQIAADKARGVSAENGPV